MFRKQVRRLYGAAYIEHTVPSVLYAGSVCQAKVRVRNEGNKVWLRNHPAGSRVDLVAFLNGILLGTYALPVDRVVSRKEVEIGFSFEVPPNPGIHTLKLDLVEQNVTLFEDQAVLPLLLEITINAGMKSHSLATEQKARCLDALSPYGVRYIEHNIPARAHAGSRFGAWVQIENCGSLQWRKNHPDGKDINLVVFINDAPINTFKLPDAIVRPFERVFVHFAVLAPRYKGIYELKLDLVVQDVTTFEELGLSPLRLSLEVEEADTIKGAELYERAVAINSWFYSPTQGVARGRDGVGFPLIISRAKGCHILDSDGRQYIDYVMGWGTALLGYAEDRIQRAVMSALDSGATLPFPDRRLVDVSQMLCEEIPCAEMVAFGKHGSDACTLAVRLARLQTQRKKVLVCGYHGWQDWYTELVGFEYSGVPDRPEKLVERFKFNDYASFRASFERFRGDLAAVMLEPSGPGEGIHGIAPDADSEFLRKIAEDTRNAGALLIFDEIITGFRYPRGGIQRVSGVVPDLACFGKSLGAGMPISALVGQRSILAAKMPHAFYGPTFKDETYSLAAAEQAIKIYRSEPVAEHVWNFGARVIKESNRLCDGLGLDAKMTGPPFRFALVFREENPSRLALLRTLYQQELLKAGIVTYNGVMLPSYAHQQLHLEQTLEAISLALTKVKRAIKENAIERCIEIPLLR